MAFSIGYRLNNGWTDIYLTALDESGNFIPNYETYEIDKLHLVVSKTNGDGLVLDNMNGFTGAFAFDDDTGIYDANFYDVTGPFTFYYGGPGNDYEPWTPDTSFDTFNYIEFTARGWSHTQENGFTAPTSNMLTFDQNGELLIGQFFFSPDEFKLWDAHYGDTYDYISWYDIAPFDGTTETEVQLINQGMGPAAPSYSHIGNTNNSSSTVEVTDTEYAQNTGPVQFNQGVGHAHRGNNQYDVSWMQIDETSLYVDNGGTNDYDESVLDANGNPTLAPTPDDDQTMGVYVNMRDGLASALVPGENEVTVANAAVIGQNVFNATSSVYAEGMYTNGTAIHVPIYVDPSNVDPNIYNANTGHLAISIENVPGLQALAYEYMETVNGGGTGWDIQAKFRVGTSFDSIANGHQLLVTPTPAGDDGFFFQIMDTNLTGEASDTYTNYISPGDNFLVEMIFDDGAVGEDSIFSELWNLGSLEEWDNVLGTLHYNAGDTTPVGVGSNTFTISDTLDAVSIEDPMNLPWEVTLSSSDDIYIGRDDIDNGDGTYTNTIEGIGFSRGNDDIDMGLGYNYATFYDYEIDSLEINLGYGSGSSNATVTMTTGETYFQRYVGVNEVWGGVHGSNLIIGSDNDPYNMPSDDTGFLKISYDGGISYDTYTGGEFGDNYLVAMGGASYLAGQGGDDSLNGYVSSDYYFNNHADLTTNGSMMYGGEGNDALAGGVFSDVLAGGQNPENTYQLDSDDFYNDIGHDFAFIGFASDNYGNVFAPSVSTLKAVSSIMINGEAIAIDTSTIPDDAAFNHLYSAFSNAVNAAINAHLNNTEQLWEYLSVSHDENNVADGFVLKYAQGLNKPEGAYSYAFSSEQMHHGEGMLPSWAPELQSSSGSTILAANMYAKASEFVEGSGDDNDRFVYYRDENVNAYDYGSVEYGDLYDSTNLNAIRGDIIADLDIGQNSLSLRAEEGEGIWFDAGVINHNSVVIDLSYVPENTVDMIDAYYTADVSITGVNGDTTTFTLGELNLPTTALYGEQNYELAYTWETVAIQTGTFGNFVGVSTNTEDVWMDKDVDVLRFEWQAVGEKVGSEGADALTGSNGSNVFAAFGGDDVLNGSGGGDSYQFMDNFGNDKVLEYGYGTDILQIGAAREHVWLERLGRRGDELEVTVNDGTHMGTISVGRQYNPYSTLQAVEEIHFGFDGAVSDQTLTINNSNHSYADIVVMKNGAEYIDLTNSADDSYIYFNKFETQDDAAVLSLNYADSYYTGFRVDYSNNTSDEIWINSYSGPETGSGVTHLVSKGFIDIQEGHFGGVEITANATVSNAYDVTRLADANVSGSVDELLFTLQWEDAASYGI